MLGGFFGYENKIGNALLLSVAISFNILEWSFSVKGGCKKYSHVCSFTNIYSLQLAFSKLRVANGSNEYNKKGNELVESDRSMYVD